MTLKYIHTPGRIGEVRTYTVQATGLRKRLLQYQLGNEHPMGCPHYEKECNHCDLPTLPTARGVPGHISRDAVVNFLMEQTTETRRSIDSFDIGCFGNVLNGREVGMEALGCAITTAVLKFPNLRFIGLETRPDSALAVENFYRINTVLRRMLPRQMHFPPWPEIKLELIVGYETHNTNVRCSLDGLNKQIDDRTMRRFFVRGAKTGFSIKVNIMMLHLPPHVTSVDQGVEDAIRSVQYLEKLRDLYNPKNSIAINLRPMHVTQKLIRKFGYSILDLQLPTFKDAIPVLEECAKLGIDTFYDDDSQGLTVTKTNKVSLPVISCAAE